MNSIKEEKQACWEPTKNEETTFYCETSNNQTNGYLSHKERNTNYFKNYMGKCRITNCNTNLNVKIIDKKLKYNSRFVKDY